MENFHSNSVSDSFRSCQFNNGHHGVFPTRLEKPDVHHVGDFAELSVLLVVSFLNFLFSLPM